MFGMRNLIVFGLALNICCGLPQRADAFMENIGKGSVEAALEKLKGMQDKLIKDLLDSGFQVVDRMSQRVSEERKATVAQIGSELQFAIDNLTAKFGSEMHGTIGAAGAELRSNLAVIKAWIDEMEPVTDRLAVLEDDFAIDLQVLPFATKYFSIRRVTGINIIQGERSSYPIYVTGERFGRPDSNEDIVVKASIGGIELPKSATFGPNTISFSIPAHYLAQNFQMNTVSIVDMSLSATLTKRNCLFSCAQEASGIFKLLLTPNKIGTLEVETKRPRYEWRPVETIKRQVLVKSPGIVILDPAPAGLDGTPRRWGTPIAACMNVKRDAWRLPNGRVLLPEDPLLTGGWSSSSWVGSNRGKDLERFDNEAIRDLGFTTGFYKNNSCDPDKHCAITADLIRSNSVKMNEVGYCDIMKVAAVDLTPDRVRGTVSIVGTAPLESLFEITIPIEGLVQVGLQSDPNNKVINLSATGRADVEVPTNALVSLIFRSFDGIERTGRLPLSSPRGLAISEKVQVGKVDVYSLSFSHDR